MNTPQGVKKVWTAEFSGTMPCYQLPGGGACFGGTFIVFGTSCWRGDLSRTEELDEICARLTSKIGTWDGVAPEMHSGRPRPEHSTSAQKVRLDVQIALPTQMQPQSAGMFQPLPESFQNSPYALAVNKLDEDLVRASTELKAERAVWARRAKAATASLLVMLGVNILQWLLC